MSSVAPNDLYIQRYKRKNKSLNQDLGDGVTMRLMLIPAGEFLMGAPESEPESLDNERPQHRVTVQRFLMGCYPVTQAQWRVVASYPQVERELNPDPSRFKGDHRPVERVNWWEAMEFCQRLSAKTGREYRLPSEAEWEYACRAGSQTPFHCGETVTTELANYNGSSYNGSPEGESRGGTTDVGRFPANEWGLHDMHGNVWEWCEDDWHGNYKSAPSDSSAWLLNSGTKVRRGGSWRINPWNCRSAYRNSVYPDVANYNFGFRVVCALPRTLP